MTACPHPDVHPAPLGGLHATMRAINDRHHASALMLLMVVVLAHWVEHLVQATQIYALGWTRSEAHGALGGQWPWLVSSEWLHFGYAIVMLIGLVLLRPGFSGTARTWWNVALGIQIWHFFEHLLLLGQAQAHHTLFGAAKPTSIIQLIIPRVELHLFYNAIVFTPMVIGVYLHFRTRRRVPPKGVGRPRPAT